MKDTEKYSERRRNERRHDNRRSNPRRSNARSSHVFDISILDFDGKAVSFYVGKTVNISAKGAYLEVIANNKEIFPPGTTIPLQINAVTSTSEGQGKTFKLRGKGTVIWNCIIGHIDHDNSLGVALEFTERLNAELDND
ncbi:MAG: PilZ domain-containing protein [Candidatus Scalindua sp.]|nr:PilZ domain-containing protein [Candidatus Scalindua sp.]